MPLQRHNRDRAYLEAPRLHKRAVGVEEIAHIARVADQQATKLRARGDTVAAENLDDYVLDLARPVLAGETVSLLVYGSIAGGAAAFGPDRGDRPHGMLALECHDPACWCRNLGAKTSSLTVAQFG